MFEDAGQGLDQRGRKNPNFSKVHRHQKPGYCFTMETEVEFVHAVTAGGSVKIFFPTKTVEIR